MKTAVEWLEEKLDDSLSDTDYLTWKLVCEDIKQAKEMEKKQIVDASQTVDQCVQMCDDFAVGFADFIEGNCTSVMPIGKYKGKRMLLQRQDFYTTSELLEIYKQGL